MHFNCTNCCPCVIFPSRVSSSILFEPEALATQRVTAIAERTKPKTLNVGANVDDDKWPTAREGREVDACQEKGCYFARTDRQKRKERKGGAAVHCGGRSQFQAFHLTSPDGLKLKLHARRIQLASLAASLPAWLLSDASLPFSPLFMRDGPRRPRKCCRPGRSARPFIHPSIHPHTKLAKALLGCMGFPPLTFTILPPRGANLLRRLKFHSYKMRPGVNVYKCIIHWLRFARSSVRPSDRSAVTRCLPRVSVGRHNHWMAAGGPNIISHFDGSR